MSLINDALKRAREAQQDQPAVARPAPQFRPVEPVLAPSKRASAGLMFPVMLCLIALLGAFFLWEIKQKSSSPTPTASSVSVPPTPAPAIESTPHPAASAPDHASSREPAVSAISNDTAAVTEPAPSEAPVPAPEPVVAQPAVPKLQALVFDPNRPSAIISGKSVFVGDKVMGFRVRAITANSATIANGSQTNVLTLEEQ